MTKDKTTLFSKTVAPICDVEEGKKKGKFTWTYDWITPKTVPLEKVKGKKKVYLVPLTETVEGIEGITAYLKGYGLKPCVNAPQYLLGLNATMKLEELPNYSWIVAAEADAASVFAHRDGGRCFLGVGRLDDERGLGLVGLGGVWDADRDWVFLCEDLEDSDTSESETLGNFEALEARVAKLEKLFNPELLK